MSPCTTWSSSISAEPVGFFSADTKNMASKLSLDAIFLLPGLAARSRSDRAVEGALDDLQLLLPGQAAEIHRIAGHPDGQAGVLLGMLHEMCIRDSGRTGLERALSGSFDLVLLDIMLPQLSGMEVLRRLRRERSTPVIMLTARDSVIDKVSGLDSGADDYITKPFAIEELLARIRAALRKRTAAPRCV